MLSQLNLTSWVLLAISMVLSSMVHAHPGHSHFGSSDTGPNWVFLIWIGVVLVMSVYGAWRLYKILTAAQQINNESNTKVTDSSQ